MSKLEKSRGFTLLEVLVSLIIISIGLLGIAKIHALAYSSTSTAGIRSIVALQAGGLATSMHANRGYWANNVALPAVVTLTSTTATTITYSPASLGAAAACAADTGPACSPTLMAAYDLQSYATQLAQLLPNSNPTTTINCPPLITPVSCTITVTWNEKAVSVNTQGAANTSAATFAPSYILFVEP